MVSSPNLRVLLQDDRLAEVCNPSFPQFRCHHDKNYLVMVKSVQDSERNSEPARGRVLLVFGYRQVI
jgi:hypothetical protein